MNRYSEIKILRENLASGGVSIGSWIQIPHASIAEIMGSAGYDWVAVDMEHGSISVSQLPNLFRSLELGNTLPLARIAQCHAKDCKQALDAGAGGVIVPMITNSAQLEEVRDACYWPSAGTRGVGFSRANLFGKNFDEYAKEAQAPILVAMIEHISAVDSLEQILSVDGLDAILIGPYDLSASMGLIGQFDHPDFLKVMELIKNLSNAKHIAAGIHVVEPSQIQLQNCIDEGYRFLAYSIDSVFLNSSAIAPKAK